VKILLIGSLIGLGLASGSAFAADLPVTAPAYEPPAVVTAPPPPPAYTWTGCYITGGVGYGLWTQDHYGETLTSLTPLTPTVSASGEPWVGTVGAGCDYQVGPHWLIGAFGDYNYMSLIYGGSFQEPLTGWVGNEPSESAWAVGARIGYLLTPKLLAYVNAGYTRARSGQINLLTATVPQTAPAGCGAGPCFIPSYINGGWFIGGGTEFALWDIIPVPGLFWRIDYRYSSFSAVDLPILTSTGAPVTCAGVACGEHLQKDYQTATTGLVWRFNVDGSRYASNSAADRPTTAAPGVGGASLTATAPLPHAWCYVNGGVGYGIWEQDYTLENGPLVTGSTGGKGWLGTVGVGCDYRVGSSRWVIGALADYNIMNMSGSFQVPFLGYTGNQTASWAWAIGGRIGYLVTPELLAYVNFGYPEQHFNQINLLTPSSAPTPYYYPAYTYESGFLFFGAGTEYALGDVIPLKGLFWRTEYRYTDYTTVSLPLLSTTGVLPGACPASTHCLLSMNKDVQTITSGFVWRFYFGEP